MLLVFFGFQFIYSWIFGLEEFAGGYSALSFMGLYLLARYVRIYENDNENESNHPDDGITSRFTLHASLKISRFLNLSFLKLFSLYLFIAAITALFVFFAYRWKGDSFGDACAGIFAHYNSPFIVVSSLLVLLASHLHQSQAPSLPKLWATVFSNLRLHRQNNNQKRTSAVLVRRWVACHLVIICQILQLVLVVQKV